MIFLILNHTKTQVCFGVRVETELMLTWLDVRKKRQWIIPNPPPWASKTTQCYSLTWMSSFKVFSRAHAQNHFCPRKGISTEKILVSPEEQKVFKLESLIHVNVLFFFSFPIAVRRIALILHLEIRKRCRLHLSGR